MQTLIKTACASVAGSLHDDHGLPCQDYVARTQGQLVSAIVLADGAGSAEHAETGARIVVKCLLKRLRKDFYSLLALDQPSLNDNEVGDSMTKMILTPVRRAVERWASTNDVTADSLACTLLFAATDGSRFICGQLGDGRVAIFNRDLASVNSPFEPTKGEFFNQTVFVTSKSAYDDLNLEWGNTSDIGGFALMSDGVEESLFNRADSSFAPALKRMMSWLDVYPSSRVSHAIADNLDKAFKERTGDDLSLGLLRILQK